MKKISLYFVVIAIAGFFLLSSCEENSVKPESQQQPKIVKTSAPAMPDWVLKKKKSADMVYFVGMSSRMPDLKEAKKASVSDAASQLVEYIGFRATAKFKSSKQMTDTESVSGFRDEIEQTLEGKGSASVIVDLEDFYYEQYSDNSYVMYSLIKFPNDWVEKERKRLQKMVSDQRQKASSYLTDSNNAVNSGDLGKALDLAISALFISGKAAENSDIYNESQNTIRMILSSLAFSVQGTPRFAYIEGGSDPLNILVASSKTGKPASGIQTIAYETSSNANLGVRQGNVSDGDGKVYYSVDKTLTSDKAVIVAVTFSMSKLEPIKDDDPEYYQELQKIQKNQILIIKLNALNKNKTVPTAVAVIQYVRDGKNPVKCEEAAEFQETLSGRMADAGYQIVSPDLPVETLISGKEEGLLVREAMVAYIQKKYPDVKRLLLGFRDVNIKGKIGEDIKFSEYDINDSGFQMIDMTLTLSLIEIASGKVEKGLTAESKGQGLNIPQAEDMAEKGILKSLEIKMKDF